MRSCLLTSLLLLCATCARAQSPVDVQPMDPRQNQKIERITHEDAGSRIDEVRYGGQTERITVQPKANVPAYEVEPASLARSRPGDHRDGLSNAGGQRSWNLKRF